MGRVLALVILLLVGISSTAQEKDKPQPAPASLAGAPLVTLEKQLLGAEKSQNFAFIESSLANDFQYIASDGALYTKPQILAKLKEMRVDSYKADNFRAWLVRDEIAIVTYEITSTGESSGQPFTFHAVMSSTWRRQKSQWQMVFHTATPLPQPPVSAVELEGLEQDLAAREAARDGAWLKQIFAENAVIVGPDGKRYGKEEMLKDTADFPAITHKLSDVKGQPLTADTGVVTSRVDVQADPKVLAYTVTTGWRRGAAGWQVILQQYTRIEK